MPKIFVKSFGCSANLSEGEIIKGLLCKDNEIVDTADKADIAVINICTVKGDKKAINEIKSVKDKKLIITGCITEDIVPKIKKIAPNASLISTHNIDKVASAINEKQEILGFSKLSKANLPKVRESPFVGIVIIGSGCTCACTYCSTKLVKKGLVSYPEEEILRECQGHIDAGCRELWITSQDNGCWGFEKKKNLAYLLKYLAENLKGDYFIRNGMSNPKHIIKFADELAEIYRHPRIFKFLHIPVQSGSNKVLQAMKRGYSAEEFLKVIELFRGKIPEITIATDIIAGFPGETGEDFQQTLGLIEKIRPDVINISRFAARPGTPAEKMPCQVHGRISKDRTRVVTDYYVRIAEEQNKKWVGWQGEIIIDEKGKNSSVSGRNFAYKPVIVPGNRRIGEKAKVKIVGATAFDLRAEVTDGIRTGPVKGDSCKKGAFRH